MCNSITVTLGTRQENFENTICPKAKVEWGPRPPRAQFSAPSRKTPGAPKYSGCSEGRVRKELNSKPLIVHLEMDLIH
jgi:hypothetical protein